MYSYIVCICTLQQGRTAVADYPEVSHKSHQVNAIATSLSVFKNKLDEHWKDLTYAPAVFRYSYNIIT